MSGLEKKLFVLKYFLFILGIKGDLHPLLENTYSFKNQNCSFQAPGISCVKFVTSHILDTISFLFHIQVITAINY